MSTSTQASLPPPRFPALRALRHVNYRWYWLSGLGQTAAQGIRQLTLAWMVLVLTGSLAQLGLVVFMQGVPMAIVSLFGGVMADRYDRRKLLVYGQLCTMTNMFILAVLWSTGQVELWHVYVSSMIAGLTQALSMPARQALIRSLVDREDLQNAVALNSLQQQSSRILWPPLAGGIIAFLGLGPALYFNAACSIVGILALLPIRGVTFSINAGRTSPLSDLAEGLRYTWSTPLVGMVMTLAMAVGLFALSLLNMAPGFAREVMGFSAGETGLFVMAGGVGSVAGSSVLVLLHVRNQGALFVGICVGLGFSIIALAINPWQTGAFIAMAAYGLATSTLSVVAHTIFQTSVPPRLLGRVASLWSLAGGLGAISALPIGLIGELYGLRWSLGGAAVIFLLVTAWVGFIKYPLRGASPVEDPALSADHTEPVE